MNIYNLLKLQSWWRGTKLRNNRLPNVLYVVQDLLKRNKIVFSNQNDDGRINSCNDEESVIIKLEEKLENRIKKPKARMWYDILLYDYKYGWIPVNIKTTTTKTSDNTGNMAMCVHSYTSCKLELDIDKTYDNGKMSIILLDHLRTGCFNMVIKKDYYFVVLNKTNPEDIIINSVRGLSSLTPNVNNLPFQVCWDKNRKFQRSTIKKSIEQFLECLQKPRPSWKENFMNSIREIVI